MNQFNMPIVKDTPTMAAVARQATLQQEIDARFTYHPPRGDQAERYGEIRAKAREFAMFLAATCPDSREFQVALTKLDEVVFFANAAIARRE